MSAQLTYDLETKISRALGSENLPELSELIADLSAGTVLELMGRFGEKERAVIYRMLHKDTAIRVFDLLPPSMQADLIGSLRDTEVAALFEQMDPDDRAELLDEVPAVVASNLMAGLSPEELELTGIVLGYPEDSIGRRMSPEFVRLHPNFTVSEAIATARRELDNAETIYTLPVVSDQRKLVGIVSLRDLMRATDDTLVGAIMSRPEYVNATDSAELAARRCADQRHLALAVVDAESRLVGIFTVDDALAILEEEDSEDHARIAGTEPLRHPYLAAPILSIVRSRIVWLLVLAIGATLTVQVLEVFEDTIAQMVVLSVFVPLLIGTGGNTGNQAATTVTRALALGDVRPRDVLKVMGREIRIGLLLGFMLGAIGFLAASVFYSTQIGMVIGLTLLAICTLAATVGGTMPLIARKIGVDPAVFANPFITTLVDATGLVIYFLVAKAVLGI